MRFIPETYTVESVTSGHPDKICDQISDAILDICLSEDPLSRVAVETMGGHGLVVVIGEVTTKAKYDTHKIINRLYKSIGYSDNLEIVEKIKRQSGDIAMGVDTGGAGDQGIMYGYACNEMEEHLPLGVVLVHQLTKQLEKLRRSRKLPWIMPDGKAQVTIEKGNVATLLVSTQHKETITTREIRTQLISHLIQPVVGKYGGGNYDVLINPTGKFVSGGFSADTGLTGRKIMVDTYGGLIPHGGGCFSGKDPTKVDRSAAYMARFAAKNIVAHGYADECLVSVSYAIGKEEPLMLTAFNETGKNLSKLLSDKFDFRPQAIIERLDLRRPIYHETATYGHFTRNHFPWEKIEDKL